MNKLGGSHKVHKTVWLLTAYVPKGLGSTKNHQHDFARPTTPDAVDIILQAESGAFTITAATTVERERISAE